MITGSQFTFHLHIQHSNQRQRESGNSKQYIQFIHLTRVYGGSLTLPLLCFHQVTFPHPSLPLVQIPPRHFRLSPYPYSHDLQSHFLSPLPPLVPLAQQPRRTESMSSTLNAQLSGTTMKMSQQKIAVLSSFSAHHKCWPSSSIYFLTF